MSATSETPMLDELARRDEQTAAAHVRAREVADQAQHARSEAARLKEELTEAFAADDQAKADKLTRAKAKADVKAGEPWDERKAGAERAAVRAKAERDQWVTAHISDLVRELSPDAHAAADAITSTAQALEDARRQWHTVEQRVLALLRIVGPEATQSLPQITGIDTAIRDALRATGDVPAPLPPGHAKREVMQADDHMLLEADERLGDSRISDEDKERFAQAVVEQAQR